MPIKVPLTECPVSGSPHCVKQLIEIVLPSDHFQVTFLYLCLAVVVVVVVVNSDSVVVGMSADVRLNCWSFRICDLTNQEDNHTPHIGKL